MRIHRPLLVGLVIAFCLACTQGQAPSSPNVVTAVESAPDAGQAPLWAQVDHNALKDTRSVYLRANAQGPIFWNAYHPDVWKLAARTGRLVLLSVGSPWCLECKAMDEDAFMSPGAVSVINQNYVAVKIDASERSDLDARLQDIAQVISLRPGWPLNMVF